jgi:hypothetical protein
LVHGKLSNAVAEALMRHEHSAQTIDQIGLSADAAPIEVFEKADEKQLDIVTSDPALANAPFEFPVKFKRSLVFLQLEGGDVEQDDAIDRLFARYKRMAPGRMYTVTGTRVKIRQLPQR